MDRKSILILIVAAALFATWPFFVKKIYPDIPAPKMTNSVTLGTNGNLTTATISAANTNRASIGMQSVTAGTIAPAGKVENLTKGRGELLLQCYSDRSNKKSRT